MARRNPLEHPEIKQSPEKEKGSQEKAPEEPQVESQAVRLELLAQTITSLIETIEQEGSVSAAGGKAQLEVLEERGKRELGAEVIEKIERAAHVHERLAQNEWEHKRLAERSTNAVRKIVELLSTDLSSEEREDLLKRTPLGRVGYGAFYDVYGLGESGLVMKELKLNYLFGAKDAARMLARHGLEGERMREYFGEMIPEFAFVISPEREKEFRKEQERIAGGGKKLYGLGTFMKIQVDRRLQENFARRDVAGEKRKGIDRFFGKIGEWLRDSDRFRKESAGVMIQEQVRGITFAEFFEKFQRDNCPTYDVLRGNVAQLIGRTRAFNERYALLWHGFDSDNVIVETDEEGIPTGEIKIIDLNFTERFAEHMRKRLATAMDKRILQPLEERFSL